MLENRFCLNLITYMYAYFNLYVKKKCVKFLFEYFALRGYLKLAILNSKCIKINVYKVLYYFLLLRYFILVD